MPSAAWEMQELVWLGGHIAQPGAARCQVKEVVAVWVFRSVCYANGRGLSFVGGFLKHAIKHTAFVLCNGVDGGAKLEFCASLAPAESGSSLCATATGC